MNITHSPDGLQDHSKQALWVWSVFFVLLVIFNGTIPFLMGSDLHSWTVSPLKSLLFGLLFYSLLFLGVPLIVIKGWEIVRQPGFLIPLCIAMLGITVWHFLPPAAALVIPILAYLHRRYDLSALGLRSHGWAGDIAAVLIMGILGSFPLLMKPIPANLSLSHAAMAGINRLFANPASTVENLFYFGFLTEQLSRRAGRWLTAPLIGLMYSAHEMSNPEYWYGGMNFAIVFVGVTIWAAIYLWRRNTVAIWIGDGLYRFIGNLF